jgi:DNA polymerase III sliding clamp (beta) subunit (PCNA family)
LISKETNYSVKMIFESTSMLIETSQTQIGQGKLELTWSLDWDKSGIWVNSTYLLQVLSSVESSHVSISFENPLSPIMIKPVFDESEESKKSGDFKHIIMPLKI